PPCPLGDGEVWRRVRIAERAQKEAEVVLDRSAKLFGGDARPVAIDLQGLAGAPVRLLDQRRKRELAPQGELVGASCRHRLSMAASAAGSFPIACAAERSPR
ncbi:hypothetical protein ABE10_01435, partial [Bacillus toyonensis]|nr:hypothetical protein [Bacillus toyonensis]